MNNLIKINEQRAFVLHRLPYRETSLLVELLTRQQGRLRLVALGARRPRSHWKSCLQSFIPLQVQWRGRGELPILQQAEAVSLGLPLAGKALYSALYVNELLSRLLVPGIAYETLFDHYLQTLCQLATHDEQPEPILRSFEFYLLQALGFGVDFQCCAATGDKIREQGHYRYQVGSGFIAVNTPGQETFSGQQLQRLAVQAWHDPMTLKSAKRFSRLVLQPHLGSRPLKSREFFVSPFSGHVAY